MKKSIPYIILATLIGAGVLAQNLYSAVQLPMPGMTPSKTALPATATPTATAVTSSYEPCAYVWAYHTDDKVSANIDSGVSAIDSTASGYASLYGEDCVYADGHSTFGVMETDFYIHQPTDDLTNEEAFGDWILQVMKIVTDIPREQIQGNYGFVEFWFEKSDSEHVIARVPIQKYMDSTHGITGAALFRMFYVEP